GSSYTAKTIHSFNSSTGISDLVADAAGNLYGTTSAAGNFGFGLVFELTVPATAGGARNLGILHNFDSGDGHPLSNLVLKTNNVFLGITQRSGNKKDGSVYQ